MRFYLTTPDGEKGPYEEQHIREWLRAGTMPGDAPVRAEGDATSAPAMHVFPGEAPEAPPGYGNPQPIVPATPNVYAPPVYSPVASNDWVHVNKGSFAQGFALGFFCGCIALAISYASSSMGTETKRGVRTGFAVAFAIGILLRIIIAASQ